MTLGTQIAQIVLTACLAAWMVSGVINNWLMPKLNESVVAMVMRFELMERDFPEDFEAVKHRRVHNPHLVRIVFLAMVLSETIAAILLVAGTLLQCAALFGGVAPDVANLVALMGALAFTVNWTGFLIGGEYFCYWYCHFGSQATHLMLAIWGTVVSGILLITA